MDSTRIAHLSDLHCNSSKEWNEVFSYITKCLTDISPHIIFITGDLVNSPSKKNFRSLKNSIEQIKTNRLLPPNLHIVVVPGNHDYYFKGNNVLIGIGERNDFIVSLRIFCTQKIIIMS